jgi:hypothetical protein
MWVRMMALGFTVGLLWITREDSVWVVPFVALVTAYVVGRELRRRRFLAAVCLLAALALGWAVPVIPAQAANYHYYGAWEIAETGDAAFTAAVRALDGIEAGPETLRVPVPPAALDAAFAVSPTMRELEPAFRPGGAAFAWGRPDGVIGGAAFQWALRSAVESVGGFSTPSTAKGYFRRIASEIRTACSDGRLRCSSQPPIGALPVITDVALKQLPQSFWIAVKTSAAGYYDWPAAPASRDSPSTVDLDYGMLFIADQFLGRPSRTLSDREAATFPGVPADGGSKFVKLHKIWWYVAHTVSPWIGVLSAMGFVGGWVLLLRRRLWHQLPIAAMASGMILLWLTRLVQLAIVDATLFGASASFTYVMPTFPLYVVVCFLLLLMTRRVVADARKRKHRGAR